MATLEQCINKLAISNPRAAEWSQIIIDGAGTSDTDWSVLEAAALLLSICVPKHISPAEGLELLDKYHDERKYNRARIINPS